MTHSLRKVEKLPVSGIDDDEESLETWESFTARFAGVVDIFLTKYLKARVLEDDPGFDGTLRDCVDHAEKKRWIASADRWMELRGFRNSAAHDYAEEDLAEFLESIRKAAPEVLDIEKLLG